MISACQRNEIFFGAIANVAGIAGGKVLKWNTWGDTGESVTVALIVNRKTLTALITQDCRLDCMLAGFFDFRFLFGIQLAEVNLA